MQVDKLSPERRLIVVGNKIETWRNTLYDAELDAEVARLTEDGVLRKSAQRRVKQSLQAIQILQKKQKELWEELEVPKLRSTE